MALFSKRPFALFCFVFFAVSFAAGYVPVWWTVVGMVGFGVLSFLIFLIRKFRRRCLGLGLGLMMACLALIHSFVLTELPMRHARTLTGEHTVLCEIVGDVRTSASYTQAEILLLGVDGREESIRANLSCDFPLEASVGDRIWFEVADVEETGAENTSFFTSRKDNGGRLLSVSPNADGSTLIQERSQAPLTFSCFLSASGWRMAASRVQGKIRTVLKDGLGDAVGTLANGFFTGDTSEMDRTVLLNFRRSGVFHLLSVSGLHLTVLLGAVEVLLRACFVPKKLRIVLVSLCGLLLLMLTGFVASACRAVLMLWLVYLQFMLLRDCDSVTALFSSAAAILLVSPYSVNDLGLWMSFQATLGLLSLYALWESSQKHAKKRKGWLGVGGRFLRSVRSALVLTLVANLFLLPISQAVFGEFSLSSLVCNLLVSPLSSVFLTGIPVFLAVGKIPFLGHAVATLLRTVGTALMKIAEYGSRFPYGVVSLKYDFCAGLVLALTVVMIGMMVGKIRRKWLFALPPVLFAVLFSAMLAVNSLFLTETEAVYSGRTSQNEMLVLREGRHLALCDLSFGGVGGSRAAQNLVASSVATEVDSLILTHWHSGHVAMVDRLSEEVLIRRICLPMPESASEVRWAEDVCDLANQRSISVCFYRSGEVISLWDGVSCFAESADGAVLCVTAVGENARLLYVSERAWTQENSAILAEKAAEAETVIVGAHESSRKASGVLSLPESAKTQTVVFGSAELGQCFRFEPFDGTLWVPKGKTFLFSEKLS